MIPTKELRLGNYVKDGNNGFPMYVYAIGHDWVQLNFKGNDGDIWECDDKDLTPIPITIELLCQIGFSLCKEQFWHSPVYEKDNIKIVHKENELWQVFIFKNMETRASRLIESLHELQNVFFAVNQRDLEIEL